MWNSYNIATFIVNIFIALGTCGAVFIALGFFKRKEKIDGWYWFYDSFIRVEVDNQGKDNCSLHQDTCLLFMRNKTTGEDRSLPLGHQEIIPTGCSMNIHFHIEKDNNYIRSLRDSHNLTIYLCTDKGTVVKLKQGMNGPACKIEIEGKSNEK